MVADGHPAKRANIRHRHGSLQRLLAGRRSGLVAARKLGGLDGYRRILIFCPDRNLRTARKVLDYAAGDPGAECLDCLVSLQQSPSPFPPSSSARTSAIYRLIAANVAPVERGATASASFNSFRP